MLAVKFYRLSHKKDTEIDVLDAGLMPIKKSIPKTGTIGFQSNSPNPVTVTTQYYHAQFILAPLVIRRKQNDMVLMLIDRRFPADTSGYMVLARNSDTTMTYLLAKKTK